MSAFSAAMSNRSGARQFGCPMVIQALKLALLAGYLRVIGLTALLELPMMIEGSRAEALTPGLTALNWSMCLPQSLTRD